MKTNAIKGKSYRNMKRQPTDIVQINIEGENKSFFIPAKALDYLSDIVELMESGKEVVIQKAEKELTTQEVADMLQVSRPYVVKLLEEGQMPYRIVGKHHRRILMEDAVFYKRKIDTKRKQQLNQITKQAQELNLGYE